MKWRALDRCHLLIIIIILSLAQPISQSANAERNCDEGLSCDVGQSVGGSSLILLQELTAIWCEVCAETDPIVEDFIQSRSDEVVRLAYHPDDGIDYLGNEFSTRQTWGLGQNPTTAEYPTIWIDGKESQSGLISDSQLQRGYFKAAGTRAGKSHLMMETNNLNGSILFTIEVDIEATNLTLAIKSSGYSIENYGDYNGVQTQNDIVSAGMNINLTNNSVNYGNESGQFDSITIISNEYRHLVMMLFTPENGSEEAFDLSKTGAVVFSQDESGNILSVQQIKPKQGGPAYESTPHLAIAALLLIGVLIASPLLREKGERKLVDISQASESEE